jgi:hypothetical protein
MTAPPVARRAPEALPRPEPPRPVRQPLGLQQRDGPRQRAGVPWVQVVRLYEARLSLYAVKLCLNGAGFSMQTGVGEARRQHGPCMARASASPRRLTPSQSSRCSNLHSRSHD